MTSAYFTYSVRKSFHEALQHCFDLEKSGRTFEQEWVEITGSALGSSYDGDADVNDDDDVDDDDDDVDYDEKFSTHWNINTLTDLWNIVRPTDTMDIIQYPHVYDGDENCTDVAIGIIEPFQFGINYDSNIGSWDILIPTIREHFDNLGEPSNIVIRASCSCCT